MVPKWLFVFLSLYFAVEIVSGSSSVTASSSVMSSSVLPSSSTGYGPDSSKTSFSASPVSSNYPRLSSTRPTASVTSSPVSSSSSDVRIPAASSSLSSSTSPSGSPVSFNYPRLSSTRPTASVTSSPVSSSSSNVRIPAASSSLSSSTSPSGSPTPSSASPTIKSTVRVTGSSGPPTQPSTTRPPLNTSKGKTIGPLEVLGFSILAVIIIVPASFGIYYVTFRKPKEDDGLNEQMVEAPARNSAQPKETEIGITNEASAGDSDSPTKASTFKPEATAPVPEVKPQEPTANASEVKPDEKECKEAEADDDGTQDSAL